MKVRELFKDKTIFSFEVFPPKKTSSVDVIYQTLDELADMNPDFISVTFGAGGSGNSFFALDIASKIKESGRINGPYISADSGYLREIEEAEKRRAEEDALREKSLKDGS